MSSATLDKSSKADVLRVDIESVSTGDTVFVKNTQTDEIEVARVSDNGIIREQYGSGAYSPGLYEIYTADPNKPVMVSSHSNHCSFHTANCRSIKRGKITKRKIITIDQAVGFYGFRHCHNCSDREEISHDEMQLLVKYDYTQ